MSVISPPPQARKPGRKISVAKTGRDAATGEDVNGPAGQLASQLGMLDFSEFDVRFDLPPAKAAARTQLVAAAQKSGNPPGGPQLLGQRPAKFAAKPKLATKKESSSDDSDSSSSSDSSDSSDSSSSDDSSSSSDSDSSEEEEAKRKPRPAAKTSAAQKKPATSSEKKSSPSAPPQSSVSTPPLLSQTSASPMPPLEHPVGPAQGIAALPTVATVSAESGDSSAENSKVGDSSAGGEPTLPPRPRAQTRANEVTMRIDVLPHMHKGTPFLKYGKRGYPHFRQFQLSDDNLRLMWYSKQKSLKQSQIRLTDVDSLVLGQTTENFDRHRAPELARSSFSLFYRSNRETLDLIAKDPNEFKMWTQGLTEILKMLKAGRAPEVRTMKALPLPISVVRGRRSTVDMFDYDTKECADDGRGPTRVNGTGNKQMYKEVAKSFQDLKKRLSKKRQQLQESHYAHCEPATHTSMMHVIAKVQASVERIQDWFQNGEYPACDDEIWRATVDLDSLTQMMAAVKSH